jgi:hypothetical protein
MAKDKKSFVLYSDQRSIIDMLSDEQAGQLLKHIYSYVNDENPELKDLSLKLAFEPIKLQLKRDLKKWDNQREQRIRAGKISAENRKRKSTSVNEKERKATVNVNGNVNVNVNDNVNEIIGKVKPSHLAPFLSWLEYRKQIKKEIKVEKTLTSLVKKFNKHSVSCCEWVTNHSIENGYQGLFWDKYNETKTNNGYDPTKNIAL